MSTPRRSLLARARALPPLRRDLVLAGVLLAEGIAEVVVLTPLAGGRLLLGFVVVALIACGCALVRRVPLAGMALALSGIALGDHIGNELADNLVVPFFATLFVIFVAGYRLEGRRLLAAALVGAALSLASTLLQSDEQDVSSFLFGVGLFIAGPLLIGQLIRSRTQLNETLREKTRGLQQARAEQAEGAALDERTRIAGELHDVVAHALSAMTIQAAAARRTTPSDPERARAAFAGAEATGREALTELRRLLGVLRKEDEDLALAPHPSLAHLEALVRRATAGGLPVDLSVEGEYRSLPAGVDLTAYRVVQEALSSARSAGGAGRAKVAVRYGDGEVQLEVADDGASHGRRLLGMSERVGVYGGELAGAPAPDGGWRISVRLPLETAR